MVLLKRVKGAFEKGVKMKRFVSLLLGLIFFTSLFSISACSNDVASVWCALSSETFVQDVLPEGDKPTNLNLAGIRGETESGQVIITAKKNISSIDFITDSLQDTNGNIIDKSNISVFAEKYVEINDPYMNNGATKVTFPALVGFYPDALLPFNLYLSHNENSLQKGLNQGIWIDIKIPVDAKAGEYKGTFKVVLNDKKVFVPVNLKVYDMVMPEEVHSRSALNIWHTQLEYGEKSNYDQNTHQIYYDFLLEKRVCSAYVPMERQTTLDEYVDYMVELALDKRVTAYKVWTNNLGISNTEHLSLNAPSLLTLPIQERQEKHEFACNQAYNGIMVLLSKMLNKNLEKLPEHEGLDLFKKAIFHFEDEPARGFRTERTKKFNEIFTKAKKDFIAQNEQVFEQYPYLKESLLNSFRDITPTDILDDSLFVSNKVDGTPDYDKGDGVTLWCLHCYKVESTAARQIIKERQSYGEQFWWYNCTRTSPAPSYYLEAVTMNIRLQSWQQYEHGFDGFLYWDVVHWQELPDCDPFKSLQYGPYGNGEGILLYPGYKYGVKTPISSIRLENIFQGQEDYEYLYMLNERITRCNEENGTSYNTQEIVAKLIANMHTGSYLTKKATAQELEQCRITILDILQLFEKGQTQSGINKIENILN